MNRFTLFSLLIISLVTHSTFSQTIKATLVDQTSKEPIPFATISLNQESWMISSEQGKFDFHINGETSEQDSIYIRSLGYEEKVIAVSNFTDSIIKLQPQDIILSEVVVLNNSYTAEQIMEKVLDSLQENYQANYTSQRVFYRDSDINKLNN